MLFFPLPETEMARSCLTVDSGSVKKVDILKVLKLFSYLQNYQSYGPGSVEQSPKVTARFEGHAASGVSSYGDFST